MRIRNRQIGWHILLCIIVFLLLMPIIFAVSNSFNTVFQVIPLHPTLENYIHVFEKLPFVRITMNTFAIAAVVTAFKTITSLVAAYSFVYFDFKGKSFLYFVMLATMFIPFTVTMIPNYLTISKIGLADTLFGVMLPQLADVLGIFLLRQSMRGIPKSLIEAARMEDVGNLKIMRDIVIPLVKPSLISTGIIFFINSWNDYFMQLIMLSSTSNLTISLGIAKLQAVMTMLIPLLLYILFQRYIINTFAMSGIKG